MAGIKIYKGNIFLIFYNDYVSVESLPFKSIIEITSFFR